MIRATQMGNERVIELGIYFGIKVWGKNIGCLYFKVSIEKSNN